ncbi:MAG: YhjD/YihY/BrkB family envelope integrity protein [Phycisphaerales bacterium]
MSRGSSGEAAQPSRLWPRGEQAGAGVRGIISAAKGQPSAGSIAGIISLIVLFISASGVFGQLQHAMNNMFDVKARPGQGVWGFLRKRLTAITIVGLLMVVLVGSMMLSTALTAAAGAVGGEGRVGAMVWEGVDLVVVTGLLTLLLAVLFKYVPDVKVEWRGGSGGGGRSGRRGCRGRVIGGGGRRGGGDLEIPTERSG